jgi:hypothetical protein
MRLVWHVLCVISEAPCPYPAATQGNVRHIRDDEAAGVKAGDVYMGPLMTLADTLADYGHHPESKYLNGRPSDHGRVRPRHLAAWGYRYHGKESEGFDPEVGTWEDEPEHVDYEPLLDDDGATPDAQTQDIGGPTPPVTTFYDALKSVPRAWLAERWRKSLREIDRIRNCHVHLSAQMREEGARLIRLYQRQQEAKTEREYEADVLREQDQESRQWAKEALATIRALRRIKQPPRLSTEGDVAYARVLGEYRRRVPRPLRNVQRGGLPLDTMCSVLVEQGIYHGEADDLDAFGHWLHDVVAKNRKGVRKG